MRLTLRTLLAYMDDILDPSDQEELGRKIEASPFATELIHRSRDAVRRLRLSAPEVLSGEGGDLHDGDHNQDANTAAEYLDNTLSPDDVAEFERNCLEAGPNADMLLAEAASCHHILTLVLGEPAEVDADLRQRMYALSRHAAPQQLRIEPAHANTPPPAPPVEAPVVTLPQRPAVDPDEAAVPDYLLEAARSRRRSRRLALTLVAGALLGSAATYLFWPGPEPTLPKDFADSGMGDLDDLESGVVEIDEAPSASARATTDVAPGAAPAWTPDAAPSTPPTLTAPPLDTTVPVADATMPPSDAALATPPSAGPPTTSPVPTPPTDAGVQPSAPPLAADGTAVPDAPAVATPPADATATAANVPPGAPANLGAAALTGAPPAAPPQATDPAPSDASLASATPAPPLSDPLPAFGDPNDPAADDAPLTPPGEPASAGGLSDPQPPRQLGAYLGLNNDLLLRFDPTAGTQGNWLRLPPRSTFTAGDRLLTLPTYRTHVVLNPDVNAYLGGGTEIDLLAPGEAGGDVNIAVPYGHLILNSGPNGNRIALVMGDQTRVIALGPSSSLAVEVRRTFLPGVDPTANPAPLEVSYYLTSGSAEWTDGSAADAPGQTAEAPASWTTVDGVDQAPLAIDKLPEWIDKEPTTTLEAGARDAIAENVASGQPATSALLELTGNTGLGRRTEVRALAARGAAYVGEFEPLIKALADPLERAKRVEQVDALRASIARDPANVDRIHAAFELHAGADAADELTELLIGFSPASIGTTRDQVKNGSMLRLINWLDDDDLTYRVLASHNLNEITGTTYLGGYRPEHTATQRKREIQFYLKRFEAGELLPKQ